MLCIICGGGAYPRMVAQSCDKEPFCLLFLDGFCDTEGWPSVPQLSIKFGEVEKALDFLHQNKVDKIVFAGWVKRPDFSQISLDKTGTTWLLRCGKAIYAGDDQLLRCIESLFRDEGFEIVSGTDYLQNIFLPAGIFSARHPSPEENRSIDIGLIAAKKLGFADVGQAVTMIGDQILAQEDISGTESLIKRSASLRTTSSGGILTKVSKPQQDLRLDLPTIGPDTIEQLHLSGFSGLAIEAEKCIVLDKEEVIRKVNSYNMFLVSRSVPIHKIFLIAGEASGDYLGGKLMEDLRRISPTPIEFCGIGGVHMSHAGLRQIFPSDELAVMGLVEIVGKIFHFKRLINKTISAIDKYKPDLVITIDSPGFTNIVNRRLKRKGFRNPIIHYVAPSVWAWRKGRAKKLSRIVDKLLTLFPFEPELFRCHGLDSVFVGHPIASDEDFTQPSDEELATFRKTHSIGNMLITLLPGSRKGELERHLPILKEVVEILRKKYPTAQFIMPVTDSLRKDVERETSGWNILIVSAKRDKILGYYASRVAVAVSGTVTLELARVGLPMVVIYRASPVTAMIVRRLLRTRWVCLVNIIAQRSVVPELLQENCSADGIVAQIEILLQHEASIRAELPTIVDLLRAPTNQAALAVLDSLSLNR